MILTLLFKDLCLQQRADILIKHVFVNTTLKVPTDVIVIQSASCCLIMENIQSSLPEAALGILQLL